MMTRPGFIPASMPAFALRLAGWICIVFAMGGTSGAGAEFRKVVLATGLQEPIQLAPAADGRLFIAERHGGLKVWQPREGRTLDLGHLEVFTGPEDGLLGLALDPGFLTNGWLYLFHSTPGVLENRVSRFTLTHDHLDPASQKILLRIPTLARKPNHSGGGLGFDAAGNLHASTGDYTFINDSGGYSPLDERPGREVHDSQRTAANTLDWRGKILRIHPEPDGRYTIPPGNLFPPGTPGTLPEIYIMGCRNPFRFSIDPRTGWLFWGDVGPDALEPDPKRGAAGFDEFNVARAAGNFGWPYFVADNKPYVRYDFATRESGAAFDPSQPENRSPNNTGLRRLPPAQPALIWYPPGPSTRFPTLGSGARSAMAGPVYHFDAARRSAVQFPREYDNVLFVFDWERGWIQEVRLDAAARLQRVSRFAADIPLKRPISMDFGPDGALYVIEWGTAWYNNTDSQVVRIEPVPVPAGSTDARALNGREDLERWFHELSNWGRWGTNDELGALNLVTPEKRRAAVALVRDGVPVSLARDAEKEPAADNGAPFLHLMERAGTNNTGFASADAYKVSYHGMAHTHIDSLCHMFHDGRMYNGFPQSEVVGTGARHLGVLNLKQGILTRGILVDIPSLRGVEFLEPGSPIQPADLDAWERKAGVRAGPGDVLLIRTGRWARRAARGAWGGSFAGLHGSCARWIHERDIAVVGSDAASDVIPSGVAGVDMPIHRLCLIAMGTWILDNCDLEALAAEARKRQRWEFLLQVAPLAVPGGTGSPVNPVATF